MEQYVKQRPLAVTLLALLVLTFTVMNAVRFGAALAFWDILLQYAPRPGPIYVAASGLIWALAGLPLCWGLWTGRRWAQLASALALGLFTAYYWTDRQLFQSVRANGLFALVVNLVLLIFASLTLLGAGSFFSQRKT